MKAIDWIRDIAAEADHLDSVHSLVDRFSFSGERQHTAIANLSGGEKRRLQLLGVLASAPNFLVLDEVRRIPDPRCRSAHPLADPAPCLRARDPRSPRTTST